MALILNPPHPDPPLRVLTEAPLPYDAKGTLGNLLKTSRAEILTLHDHCLHEPTPPTTALPLASVRFVRPQVVTTPRLTLSARAAQPDDSLWFASVRHKAPKPPPRRAPQPLFMNMRDANAGEAHSDIGEEEEEDYLTFDEFCALMANRDEHEFKLYELAARFRALDGNGNGVVERSEFARASLIDALTRTRARVLDMLHDWDKNGDGRVSRLEFRRAVASCGFDFAKPSDVDAIFDEIDEDSSGLLDVRELSARLRPGVLARSRHALRQAAGRRVRNRANASRITLRATGEATVPEQLVEILGVHRARVLDLFREWDEDLNGLIDASEFRAALSILGYDAPRADVDDLFATFDVDSSGAISYSELDRIVSGARRPARATRGGAPLHAPRRRAPALWLPREAGRGALANPDFSHRQRLRTALPPKPLHAPRTLPPLAPRYI